MAMVSSVCVSACFYFHLLHPVLGAFAGVLMPDVVSGVSESHGTHSVLHIHLPLIHLPGSKICVSYLAKIAAGKGPLPHMLVRWKKAFYCLVMEKKTKFEYDLSIVSTDTCLIKIVFPVRHILAAHDSTGPVDQ